MLPNKKEDEKEKGFFLSKEFFILVGFSLVMGALLVYTIVFWLPFDYKKEKTEECIEFYKHKVYFKGCEFLIKEYLSKFE